jgi:hypothetical protein
LRLLISGHRRIKAPAQVITRMRSRARGRDAHGMRTVEQQDKPSPANRPLLLGATFYYAYWCNTIRSGVKSLNPMIWNRDFLDQLSWISGWQSVRHPPRAPRKEDVDLPSRISLLPWRPGGREPNQVAL